MVGYGAGAYLMTIIDRGGAWEPNDCGDGNTRSGAAFSCTGGSVGGDGGTSGPNGPGSGPGNGAGVAASAVGILRPGPNGYEPALTGWTVPAASLTVKSASDATVSDFFRSASSTRTRDTGAGPRVVPAK